MDLVVWTVRPIGEPPTAGPCVRCAHPLLESTGRFRVNSNGRLHDVWLVYRCPRCGKRLKRAIHRRARERAIAPSIEAYRRDDPALGMEHAVAFARAGEAVPHVVERPPLPKSGVLWARIAQPQPCGVRWDRLLSRELEWPRSRVRAAWTSGRLQLPTGRKLRHAVAHGDRFVVVLDPSDARCADRIGLPAIE